MKIVILGAGQVGSSVAESLVSEQNDITVVDIESGRLRALQDRLDLRTITGSASLGSHISRCMRAPWTPGGGPSVSFSIVRMRR